ncbi:MAG TPA: hypothetical protein DDZ51_08370 [Planctomycetaceae bacterium]|nr:hypothetical protein [Planctomycetaceae bacterium]
MDRGELRRADQEIIPWIGSPWPASGSLTRSAHCMFTKTRLMRIALCRNDRPKSTVNRIF